MNKAQRKAHRKAIKANQKAARKAKAAAAQTPEAPMQDLTLKQAVALVPPAAAVAQAATLSDERARELMAQAAESISRVIEFAEKALAAADPAEVLAAQAVVRGDAEGEQRKGTKPVLQMLQVLLRAKALLPRLLKITNPGLFAPQIRRVA